MSSETYQGSFSSGHNDYVHCEQKTYFIFGNACTFALRPLEPPCDRGVLLHHEVSGKTSCCVASFQRNTPELRLIVLSCYIAPTRITCYFMWVSFFKVSPIAENFPGDYVVTNCGDGQHCVETMATYRSWRWKNRHRDVMLDAIWCTLSIFSTDLPHQHWGVGADMTTQMIHKGQTSACAHRT